MCEVEEVMLRCDDHAEALVFARYKHSDDDMWFEFSIEDAYCGGDYMGIKGRFRRAWHAFWAKPICYTGVYVEKVESVWHFLEQCNDLATKA